MFVARLLALLTLFVVAHAEYCGTYTFGSRYGQEIQLPDVIMSPGIRDWTVNIPSNGCVPPYSTQVGTFMSACDIDLPPVDTLYSFVNGFVHRTGNLREPGVIHTTVYCTSSSYGKESAAKDIQAPAPRASPVMGAAPIDD